MNATQAAHRIDQAAVYRCFKAGMCDCGWTPPWIDAALSDGKRYALLKAAWRDHLGFWPW